MYTKFVTPTGGYYTTFATLIPRPLTSFHHIHTTSRCILQ